MIFGRLAAVRNWFSEYGHAYGGLGVSLALAAGAGVIASFWVWIAAVMGVYWERKVRPAAVAKMEELQPRKARCETAGYRDAGHADSASDVSSACRALARLTHGAIPAAIPSITPKVCSVNGPIFVMIGYMPAF